MNFYTTTTAVIVIIKPGTLTKSAHVDISVLKRYRLILTKLRCSTQAAGNNWLHPLPSYNNSQNKHSKDSYYSIISSLVDTYYCLIWACFESVVLNTGPGVILTSAVLRTSENSRIRVCVHWENANWLNCCAQHLLFSPPSIRRTHQPFFCRCEEKKAGFSARPLAILRDRYAFLEHTKTDGGSSPRQNKRCCFHRLCLFQELKFCSAICQGQAC